MNSTPAPLPYSRIEPYQHDGIDFIFNRNESLLLAKMGAGKTLMTATAITELMQEGELSRVLILAPKRVATLVWRQEFMVWEHLVPWVDSVGVAVGTEKKRREIIEDPSKRVVVTNFENLEWLIRKYPRIYDMFDGLVIDELSKMKSWKSIRHRTLRKVIDNFKWRTGLTGTLSSNGVEDIYPQVYLIDHGESLGGNKAAFLREYMERDPRNMWKYKPVPGAVERITEAMAHLAFQVSARDYNPAPLHNNVIRVPMSAKLKKMYTVMEENAHLQLESGTEIMSPTAAALTGKLQQMVQGAVYTESELTGERSYEVISDEKLDALGDVIDDMGGEPLLVCYKYKHDLERLQKRWPAHYLGSGVSTKDEKRIMDAWNAGELPLLYCQPQSIGHGLNMQKGGNTMVWFTLTWSRDEHDQMVARLRRKGQKKDSVWVHYITMSASVDVDVMRAIREKTKIADAVERGIHERNQLRDQNLRQKTSLKADTKVSSGRSPHRMVDSSRIAIGAL